MESIRYFVASNGDTPDRLYFDLFSAQMDEHQFIDEFDEAGDLVCSYEARRRIDEDGELTIEGYHKIYWN